MAPGNVSPSPRGGGGGLFAPAMILVAWTAAACSGCQDEAATPLVPEIGPAEVLIPSDAVPPEAELQLANNNLDVSWHEGRLYLAWRTAEWHYASKDTVLHVMSADADESSWRYEGSFVMGTDLREPRLLSIHGGLFLYFAVLGKSATSFDPQGAMVTRRLGVGAWTEPQWILPDGFIPWRTKLIDGQAHMLAYGGDGIYDMDGLPEIEVRWLTSVDGLTWEPVSAGRPVVHLGGGSETDLAILDSGVVIAVMRNEAGDAGGFGSKICRGEADDPASWACIHDVRKFDSPLVFEHDQRVWLIARRHLAAEGAYDLGRTELSFDARSQEYQLAYWGEPKRCSLWEVDPETLEVMYHLDLEGRGDTCFAGLVADTPGAELGDDETYRLFNYTSTLDPEAFGGEEPSWIEGQQDATWIVRQELRFLLE